MTTHYILAGSVVVDAYYEGDMALVKKLIDKGDGAIVKHNSSDGLNKLFELLDGWNGCVEIEHYEYKRIISQ